MEIIITSREDLGRIVEEAVSKAISAFKPARAKEEKYLSIREAAKKAGVSYQTLYRGVSSGRIPSRKFGSRTIKVPADFFLE